MHPLLQYKLLEVLFSPEQLDSTCEQIVKIALGRNDDPLPKRDDDQILVEYYAVEDIYIEGMTVRQALEIMRGKNKSESEIKVNMQKEEVISYLLENKQIRLYQHGMTVETATQAIQKLNH